MRASPERTGRRALLSGAGLLGLCACGPLERVAAVPAARRFEATVLGLPNERFHPTKAAGQQALRAEFQAAVERRRRALGYGANPPDPLPELDLLAVSGGGDDGAFGAGVLTGWTQRGDRPVFSLVTGISTGALTAPFAYLGSEWDAALRAVYTQITLADIAAQRWFTAALTSDGMADNAPLLRTISRHLDERMLAEIARGHEEGRLLLIGTTNLDAERPVIWNIGAIAASGHPRALETVRRVLLASSAIPGAFSPVLFDVTAGGQGFQELHVDGGAFAQAFLYPESVGQARREAIQRRRAVFPLRAWVIRNGRLEPEGGQVERRTVGIAGRAVSAMISASGFSDVARIHNAAQRDHVQFRLAHITSEFNVPYTTLFNPAYMRPLFDYGARRTIEGRVWIERPPL